PDRSVQHDLRPVRPRRVDLRSRRVLRHADDGPDAVAAGGERDTLRMVARRRADDATPLLFFGELRELVHRPADLVRASALEHLRLETDVEAGALAEETRGQQRRVIDEIAHPGARLFEGGTGEREHRPSIAASG